MRVVVLDKEGGEAVATYDEQTREVDSQVPELKALEQRALLRRIGPMEGVNALWVIRLVPIKPSHPSYMWAFAETAESLGYAVADDSWDALIKRAQLEDQRRNQRRQR
jgi:hypothetical protein